MTTQLQLINIIILRLPIVSGPGSPQHPVPICIPGETFDWRGSHGSSDLLFSNQQCFPTLGYKVKHWPHNINFHNKYRIRLWMPHHDVADWGESKTTILVFRVNV